MSLKIRGLFYLLFSILILSLLLYFFFGFKHSNSIGEVHIEISNPLDKNFISEKEILKKVKKEIKGKKLKEISIKNIENIILKNSGIEKIDISLQSNTNLKVSIVQKIPICRIFETNKSYFLDKNYSEILTKDIIYSPEVILVTGKLDKENKPKIITLVKYIRNDNFFTKQIIEINIDTNNEITLYTLEGKHTISFGKIENINRKFTNLYAFYKKYLFSDKISQYKELNLEFKNQVIGVKNE